MTQYHQTTGVMLFVWFLGRGYVGVGMMGLKSNNVVLEVCWFHSWVMGVYMCIWGPCIKVGGLSLTCEGLTWNCFLGHSRRLTGYVLSFWWLAVTGHAAEGIWDGKFGMCCRVTFVLIAVIQLAWLDLIVVAMVTRDLETLLFVDLVGAGP